MGNCSISAAEPGGFFVCARHGNYLGGESPLWGYTSPTTKEAQGIYREVRAGGSVE